MNFFTHGYHRAAKWPHVYIAIDIHDTIFKGTYQKNNEGKVFYPWAKEVLQQLSRDPRVKLIIYTASHEGPARGVISWLAEHDIKIFALNENPDHTGTDLCDFSRKFYFDILLEDKAGFEGWKDWFHIMKELQRMGKWEYSKTHLEKMEIVHAIWNAAGHGKLNVEKTLETVSKITGWREEALFWGFDHDYLDRAWCSCPLGWRDEYSQIYIQTANENAKNSKANHA